MNNKEISEKLNTLLETFLEKERESSNIKNDFLDFLLNQTQAYVLNGGKRLRPTALCKAYELIKGEINEDILKLSIAVELYHASTLIHDDIMDEDTQRRNKDTIFESVRKHYKIPEIQFESNCLLFNSQKDRFAVTQGILAGNILSSLSLKAVLDTNFDEVKKNKFINILINAQKGANFGQILDTVYESKKDISENDYLKMVKHKTGFLFASSIEMGLIAADSEDATLEKIKEYSFLVSESFQLHDDLMDIDEDSIKGHEFGSDIKQGKKTLLIIKALEMGNAQEKEFLINSLGNSNCDVEKCVKIIKKCGAYNYVVNLAQENVKNAITLIAQVPNNSYFVELANFVINRKI